MATRSRPVLETGSPELDIKRDQQTSMGDATVRFIKSKREATWSLKENRSILELAEIAGLSPSYRCRAGVCGSCTARLTSGKVKGGMQLDGLNVLLCSARPATAIAEVEL